METEVNKELNRQNQLDHQQSSLVKKILLLGAGQSGKSTVTKQFRRHAKGFSVAERERTIAAIHDNITTAVTTLRDEWPHTEQVMPEIVALSAATPLTEDWLPILSAFWQHPITQTRYRQRAEFQLDDSADYFLSQLDRFLQAKFVPTDEDIIRVRVRTTGLVEHRFEFGNQSFLVVDAGGQRSERTKWKWLVCFQDVTVLIYVVSLSEYDEKLYEDQRVGRWDESLRLFEEVSNFQWFRKTPFILFCNKVDLLHEKIARDPSGFRSHFPLFKGHGLIEATSHLVDLVKARYRGPADELYVHTTCATDPQQMAVIFQSVKHTVMKQSLREGGLM